jgi:hypothetical protein
MTAPPTVGELAQAEAHHAARFGRGSGTFEIGDEVLKIASWSVVSNWHVLLGLEDGRRVEVDPDNNVVKVWSDSPSSMSPAAALPTTEEDPKATRAILSGEQPSPQLSMFEGAL